METQQTLTPNQVKRLVLIRSSIISIQDSPEFSKMDYYPDLTLGDAVQAIEELIEHNEPSNFNVEVCKLTIHKKRTFLDILAKSMVTSFLACGFFACAALFSNGVDAINNHTPKNLMDNIDWHSISEVTTGLSACALAVSGTCALSITVRAKENS